MKKAWINYYALAKCQSSCFCMLFNEGDEEFHGTVFKFDMTPNFVQYFLMHCKQHRNSQYTSQNLCNFSSLWIFTVFEFDMRIAQRVTSHLHYISVFELAYFEP